MGCTNWDDEACEKYFEPKSNLEEVTGVRRICTWERRKKDPCGKYAPYDLGYPDDDRVPVCSLHASRASTLGWPIKRVASSYPSKATP
jgi:hypothetical protein